MVFYLPDFEHPLLPESEAQHCLKVLRKRKGDMIQVTDGKGQKAEAEILVENTKRCEVNIRNTSAHSKGWNHEIWLAVAPTKQLERMEWMVEKCTEIGVDGILFLKTQRTERPVLNLDRLEKTALSAMKQSGQAWLPELKWLPDWKDFPWNEFSNLFCADLGSNALSTLPVKEGKSLIFIGPEGDFTPEEMSEIYHHEATAIRLRPQVLRTETAGLYALGMYHFSQQ